jgi:mannan endo-1,4-beta-mannosidase
MLKKITVLFTFVLLAKFAFAQSFVKVKNHQFTIKGKPYYYIGTNYWYGGLLAMIKDPARGKQRLVKELDFLKAQGVNNLRVLVGSEGEGRINGVDRVKPSLQPKHGDFDANILNGLDFLLMEMRKRDMYAVLYLSNNWEWSGGFLQYLNWNGQIDGETLKRKLTWDEQRDYTSKFYTCESCKTDYLKQLRYILAHKSIYTHKTYTTEPAIMAWELANEPRPMRDDAIPAYQTWIANTSALLKKLDPNHLVTIGTEGTMGTAESAALFTQIHQIKTVDYLTLHIWPKNWGWFKEVPTAANLPTVIEKTNTYIDEHLAIANAIKKPLVIEEFGLPRDGHSFENTSTTSLRDAYYQSIFAKWKASKIKNGAIAGCNFWAFGGTSRPIKGQLFWKDGDDFSGDPPQEEQGLNAVFDTDQSTWKIIKTFTKK